MHRTLLAAAAGITLGAGLLIPAGVASAHTGHGGLTGATCISPGDSAWKVQLTITATDQQLDPHADITYTGNAMQGVELDYSHQFTTQAKTFSAKAHIYWTDGFTQDVDLGSVTRPEGCVPPTSSTSPPTTTCSQAIPPRADCGTPTPLATTVPAPPTTVAEPTTPPTVTTTPTTAAPVPPTNPPPVISRQVNQLPATGASPWLIVGIALFFIGCGVFIWAVIEVAKRVDRCAEAKR